MMKILPLKEALLRRRILRANIVLGLGIFMAAVYLMLTADYPTYVERQAGDAFYTRIAISGLLYTVAFWFACIMSKPFWFPSRGKN